MKEIVFILIGIVAVKAFSSCEISENKVLKDNSKQEISFDVSISNRIMCVLSDSVSQKFLPNHHHVKFFYEKHDYKSIWFDENQVAGNALDFIQLLAYPELLGLNKDAYHLKEIMTQCVLADKNWKRMEKKIIHISNAEILLTDAWFTFALHVSEGQLAPDLSCIQHKVSITNTSYSEILHNALKENKLPSAIKTIQPQSSQYTFLIKALSRLTAPIDSNGTGKYQKIAIALERLRKERIKDSVYILINIPAFKFDLIEGDSSILRFKVIVGKKDHPTPLINSYVTGIVTYPYWYVPKSIATREILPEIKRDTSHLRKKRYQLIDNKNKAVDYKEIKWDEINVENFEFTIRQASGPHNALGLIKFNFPNRYQVYMHDTPAKRLFEKDVRAFSHGCVRLEKPFLLVEALYQKGYFKFSSDSVQRIINYGINRHIPLKEKIPIYIRYYTAEADSAGNVFFYEDIYKEDEKWQKALFDD